MSFPALNLQSLIVDSLCCLEFRVSHVFCRDMLSCSKYLQQLAGKGVLSGIVGGEWNKLEDTVLPLAQEKPECSLFWQFTHSHISIQLIILYLRGLFNYLLISLLVLEVWDPDIVIPEFLASGSIRIGAQWETVFSEEHWWTGSSV